MSDISGTQLLETLRMQAWERSKAELRSVLHTYHAQYNRDGTKIKNGFDRIGPLIETFILDVERML